MCGNTVIYIIYLRQIREDSLRIIKIILCRAERSRGQFVLCINIKNPGRGSYKPSRAWFL